jgi:hypothetical protein
LAKSKDNLSVSNLKQIINEVVSSLCTDQDAETTQKKVWRRLAQKGVFKDRLLDHLLAYRSEPELPLDVILQVWDA